MKARPYCISNEVNVSKAVITPFPSHVHCSSKLILSQSIGVLFIAELIRALNYIKASTFTERERENHVKPW